MDDRDDRFRRDLEDAYGEDLPGEEFDRAVIARIADGGGEHEIALAPPRRRSLLAPGIAAAAAVLLVLLAYPALVGPGAAGEGDVTGAVRTERGRPGREAKLVGVVKTWSGGYSQVPISGVADRRGRFAIEDVYPPGEKYAVHLVAFAEGAAFASRYELRETGGELEPLEFELERASPVTFRFRDPDGRAVAGVALRPDSRTPPGGEEQSVYAVAAGPVTVASDEDGRATVDWFAKGDAAVVSWRTTGGDWTARELAVEGKRGETVDVVVGGLPAAEDVADVPAEDLRAGGDPKKRYALIGPVGDAKPPSGGYRLLLVLPGGTGSMEFHPFVKRLAKHAVGPGWLVAQLAAVEWAPGQDIVWPTAKARVTGMEFTTEEFVAAVVADVAGRTTVDRNRVYALGWSSSGPALYAAMLADETPLHGAFVAMSVFHEARLPSLDAAKGRRFYLLHSPDDTVCPFADAERAKVALTKAGAGVELETYAGGHGWRGDPYGMVRAGLAWLTR